MQVRLPVPMATSMMGQDHLLLQILSSFHLLKCFLTRPQVGGPFSILFWFDSFILAQSPHQTTRSKVFSLWPICLSPPHTLPYEDMKTRFLDRCAITYKVTVWKRGHLAKSWQPFSEDAGSLKNQRRGQSYEAMDVSWWVLGGTSDNVACMSPRLEISKNVYLWTEPKKKSQIPVPGARGLIARVSVGSHQWCIKQRANLNRGARNSTLGVLVTIILLIRIHGWLPNCIFQKYSTVSGEEIQEFESMGTGISEELFHLHILQHYI